MKIVLAEKVSPATLAVLKEEPGWQIVTADQIASSDLAAWKRSSPTPTRWSSVPPCRSTPSCLSRLPSFG